MHMQHEHTLLVCATYIFATGLSAHYCVVVMAVVSVGCSCCYVLGYCNLLLVLLLFLYVRLWVCVLWLLLLAVIVHQMRMQRINCKQNKNSNNNKNNNNNNVGSDSAAAVPRFSSDRLSGMRRKWFSFLLLNYKKTSKSSVLAMLAANVRTPTSDKVEGVVGLT